MRSNRASFRSGAAAISARSSQPVRHLGARDAGRSKPPVDNRASFANASDDRLIARAARGEQLAWAAIVERHLSSLVGYAWYVLQDRSEAEDIAQEAFVRLFNKAADWRPNEANVRTWLHRVTTNLCIDRKRSLRRLIRQPDFKLEEIPARETLEADVSRANAVGRALALLPPRQRVAIVLAHYQGFSNPEAAQIMGTSVESVESLLARARRALRRTLGPIVEELLETT